MKERIFHVSKRYAVVLIAGILALISCFFAFPRTLRLPSLPLRFFLLLSVYQLSTQGLKECNVGERVASRVLRSARSVQSISVRLVLLGFLLSLFFSNELVLTLLFPVTVMVLSQVPHARAGMIHTLVLLCIAVCFGGMLLPFGNFQNLFLYAQYGYSVPAFFRMMYPFSAVGLLLALVFAGTFRQNTGEITFSMPENTSVVRGRDFTVYLLLYAAAILLTLPYLPDQLLLPLIFGLLLLLFLYDRRVFLRADYSVLLLFFFLLVLTGNLEELDLFRALRELLRGRETWWAIGLSQLLGNVPAAVLLSRLTTSGRSLIIGSNLGALGVFWSSVTGIQSLRLYGNLQHGDLLRYLRHATTISVQFLLVMCFLAFFTGNL